MTEAEMYLIALKMIAITGISVLGGAFLGVCLYCLLEDWADRRAKR